MQALRYEFVPGHMNWPDAQEECQARGGNLATIESDAENMLVWETFGKTTCTSFWIGYNDRETEGKMRWASGSGSKFTKWRTESEPSNSGGNEDCVYIGAACLFGFPNSAWEDKWNDGGCVEGDENFMAMGALCEIHGDPDIRGNTCPGHIRDHATQYGDACYLQRRGEDTSYAACEKKCGESGGRVACPRDQKTIDWLDDNYNMDDVGDRWIDGSCQNTDTSVDIGDACFLMDHGAEVNSARLYSSNCGEGDSDECICQLDLTTASPSFVKPSDRSSSSDSSSSTGLLVIAVLVGISVVVIVATAAFLLLRMRAVSADPLEGTSVAELVEVSATVSN